MTTEIVKLEAPELQVLEQSKADQIRTTFEPMAKMLAQFEEQYNEIVSESEKEITKELTAKAKRIRLDIGKVRIETGKLKDKQKEYIKLEDRAIMGVHNILVWAVKEKEDKLKSIEDYFEIQEQKRLEALQSERAEKISPYLEDAHERKLSDMDEDVWNAYFQSKKKEYEDRIEAEKKAELERIEREKKEAEEREAQRLENERLKKEAEAREKELAKERAKVEAERKAAEEKAARERAEAEAKIKAEREAREKMEAELRAKEQAEKERIEAEEKAKKEAEELAKKQAAAPDKEKLTNWVNSFELPQVQIKNKELLQVQSEIEAKFNSFKAWAINQIQPK